MMTDIKTITLKKIQEIAEQLVHVPELRKIFNEKADDKSFRDEVDSIHKEVKDIFDHDKDSQNK